MSKVTAEQINASLKRFSQELAKCSTTEAEEVPPGWFTVAELAEEIGIGIDCLRDGDVEIGSKSMNGGHDADDFGYG